MCKKKRKEKSNIYPPQLPPRAHTYIMSTFLFAVTHIHRVNLSPSIVTSATPIHLMTLSLSIVTSSYFVASFSVATSVHHTTPPSTFVVTFGHHDPLPIHRHPHPLHLLIVCPLRFTNDSPPRCSRHCLRRSN